MRLWLRYASSMPRAVKIGVPVLVTLLLGAVLAFGPIVRAKARAQAEARGLSLQVESVRPGKGKVWLRGVTLRVPQIPAVQLELHHVEVRLNATLGVRQVRIAGGRVVVRGPLEEVQRQVKAYRASRPKRAPSSGPSLDVAVSGVEVIWHDALAGVAAQLAWGVQYSREDGAERVSADLVRAGLPGVAFEAKGPRVELVVSPTGRTLRRVGSDSVLLDVHSLDAIARVRRDVVAEDAPPKEHAPEPLALDPKRGPRLRKGLNSFASLLAAALPKDAALDLDGVRLQMEHDGQNLNLGPARVTLRHDGKVATARVSPGSDAKHPLRIALALPLGEGDVELFLAGGPVSLGLLGVKNGDLGLTEVDQSTLKADLTLRLAADGGRLEGHGSAKLSKLALEKTWLSKVPVRGIELGFRGRAAATLDGSRLDIEEGELTVGQVKTEAKGFIERYLEGKELHTRATLEGGVPLASCQAILDSMPEGLAPLLDGMRMTGTYSLTGNLTLDTLRPADVVTRWSVANECRVSAVPANVSTRRFKSTWTREVKGADGRLVQLQSGPGTLGWVSRGAISRHMETAVLICEDGAFFRHRGFDQEAIRNSIRENLKAKKFVRGASTISMQLAKNLYLPREKTFSRKLQEAWLTLLLEQELTKDEMLELYLNVIEFGPGIYGIGAAAAHYFNTSASQLSLGQALYLGSILPSPKRQYFGADGRVTPGWMGYLRRLMRIGNKIRRVSDSELEDALLEQVTFRVPYSPRLPRDEEELSLSEEAAPAPDAEVY